MVITDGRLPPWAGTLVFMRRINGYCGQGWALGSPSSQRSCDALPAAQRQLLAAEKPTVCSNEQ